MGVVAENIQRIEERMQNACTRTGRRREDVRLMAVSKRQPIDRIEEGIAAGLRLFGESIVQETKERIHLFPEDSSVHLIGHLQRNKAKDAAAMYGAVQSLDDERTVTALARRLEEMDKTIDAYIEMNTSGEDSKYGVGSYAELASLAEMIEKENRLRLVGLMTIGPLTDDERAIHSAFASLRDQKERLERELERALPELSIGMSQDLEIAIAEGSTMVRIGTGIFGDRA